MKEGRRIQDKQGGFVAAERGGGQSVGMCLLSGLAIVGVGV